MPTFNVIMGTESKTCTLAFDVPLAELENQVEYWRAQYPEALDIFTQPYKPDYSKAATRFMSLYGK